jgi:hypothetical protein
MLRWDQDWGTIKIRMHIESEAGPSRAPSPPTLPPRPEPTSIIHLPQHDPRANDNTTERSTDAKIYGDQMMIDAKGDELYYRTYRGEEEDLVGVKRLIDQELSEPYVPHMLTSMM